MNKSIDVAIIETQLCCVDLQQEIDNCRNTLDVHFNEGDDVPHTKQSVLHAKLVNIQTKVEIEKQKDQELNKPVNHPLALSKSLLNQLHQTIAQTKIILQITETRCKHLDQDVEEKENTIIQQTRLNEALTRRLQEIQPQEDLNQSFDEEGFVDSYSSDLLLKNHNCRKQCLEVKEKMSSFLKKHFPSNQPLKGTRTNIQGMLSQPKMLPLERIIDNLVLLAIEKPENPYLTLEPKHWDQHIELLLSYGLATRHSSDCNKIKLAEMHI